MTMSTDTADTNEMHATPELDEVGYDPHHEHASDRQYVVIAIILAVITAAEVAASYLDLGAFFIPLLLIMMSLKFFIVASFFMHLRFDNKIFSWMFYFGLALALAVYIGTLLTFQFFQS